MATEAQRLIAESLVNMMRPLIRILLRNGVTYKALTEIIKSVYVEIAGSDFGIPGRKQTDSRISVITGLSRKEVKRVKTLGAVEHGENLARYNRAARVISGWTQDDDFHDKRGEPLDLPLDDSDFSFAELVRRYSGDAPPRAVLDELEQVGAVKRIKDDNLKLITRAFIPPTDSPDRLGMFGVMAADLMTTLNHNLVDESGDPYMQRIVFNEHIRADEADDFHDLARRQGQKYLEKLDQWLSKHQVKGKSKKKADLHRVGIGLYYFDDL